MAILEDLLLLVQVLSVVVSLRPCSLRVLQCLIMHEALLHLEARVLGLPDRESDDFAENGQEFVDLILVCVVPDVLNED